MPGACEYKPFRLDERQEPDFFNSPLYAAVYQYVPQATNSLQAWSWIWGVMPIAWLPA